MSFIYKPTSRRFFSNFNQRRNVSYLKNLSFSLNSTFSNFVQPFSLASPPRRIHSVASEISSHSSNSLFHNSNLVSLSTAIEEGSKAEVLNLLQRGADPNQNTLSNGFGPLLEAARSGNVEMVSLLIQYGANVNKATEDTGLTPLLLASAAGHIHVVQVLLDRGARINLATKDNGATPLFEASREGHVQIVKMLIKRGANPTQATTDNNNTPLNIACELDHRDVVRELLLVGSDMNVARKDGLTPLTVACLMGNVKIIEMLLKSGANPNLVTVDSQSGFEITPLLFTLLYTKRNLSDIVKLLIQYNANVEEAVNLGKNFGRESQALTNFLTQNLLKISKYY